MIKNLIRMEITMVMYENGRLMTPGPPPEVWDAAAGQGSPVAILVTSYRRQTGELQPEIATGDDRQKTVGAVAVSDGGLFIAHTPEQS